MSRQTHLQAEYVNFIPERLGAGKLYVSRRYSTASHLCCCGCGLKVVTPLKRGFWQLTEHNKAVTLYPSIGNWSFPCQSHYWIIGGRVEWAEALSPERIASAKKRDRQDAESKVLTGWRFQDIRRHASEIWSNVKYKLQRWFRQ